MVHSEGWYTQPKSCMCPPFTQGMPHILLDPAMMTAYLSTQNEHTDPFKLCKIRLKKKKTATTSKNFIITFRLWVPILNANIRTFNSYAVSPKLHLDFIIHSQRVQISQKKKAQATLRNAARRKRRCLQACCPRQVCTQAWQRAPASIKTGQVELRTTSLQQLISMLCYQQGMLEGFFLKPPHLWSTWTSGYLEQW